MDMLFCYVYVGLFLDKRSITYYYISNWDYFIMGSSSFSYIYCIDDMQLIYK